MSLNWSIADVKDWKALADSDEEWRVTDAIVWATLMVDIGSILRTNLQEWEFRLKAADLLSPGSGYAALIPHLERRIGLRTNVMTKTRKSWWSRNLVLMERRVMAGKA